MQAESKVDSVHLEMAGRASPPRKGWALRQLGEVCTFENGDRGVNYPSKLHRTETGIPFVNAGHLNALGLDMQHMDYIPKERYNLLGSGKIRKGDILFCLRGSLGKYARVSEFSEGAIASSLVIVRPNAELNADFLMAYFESSICADMISDFSNGAAQPNLSAGSLKKFSIPIPPLPEQKRIVAILDEAFAAIAKAKENAETNLRNAKELFESYLQGVFANPGEGWEEKTLGEILTLEYGKPLPDTKRSETGQYPVYGANGEKTRTNVFLYDERSIIVGRKGSAGEVNLTENKFWPLDVTYYVRTDNQKFNVDFLYNALKSLNLPKLAKGVKPGINRNEVYAIPIATPHISEQQSIVAKLDALSAETKKLEATYQQKLDDLEELKKSILQKAFSGGL